MPLTADTDPFSTLAQANAFASLLDAEQVLKTWLYQRPDRSIDSSFRGGWWVLTAWAPRSSDPKAKYEIARASGITPDEAREALASYLRERLARDVAGLGTLSNIIDNTARDDA